MKNQCDGCRRGLMVDDKGIHRDAQGHIYMSCERKLYENGPDSELEKQQREWAPGRQDAAEECPDTGG